MGIALGLVSFAVYTITTKKVSNTYAVTGVAVLAMAAHAHRHSYSKKTCVCYLIVAAFTVHMVIIIVYLQHNGLKRLPTTHPKGFEVQLVGREKELLLSAIDVFSDALTEAEIPFYMYGGTLIGSWRHHGQIPWDDDVDFAVPKDMKTNVSHILNALKPNFILNEQQNIRWKFYSPDGAVIPGVSWRFPFLDINFYCLNDTHVWDDDLNNYKDFVYAKDVVFPLTKRPFEGRWLPSPRDIKAMLTPNYDLDMCMTGPYNHRKEKIESKVKVIDCNELHSLFPFVRRQSGVNGGCNETLRLQDNVVSWIWMADDKC